MRLQEEYNDYPSPPSPKTGKCSTIKILEDDLNSVSMSVLLENIDSVVTDGIWTHKNHFLEDFSCIEQSQHSVLLCF